MYNDINAIILSFYVPNMCVGSLFSQGTEVIKLFHAEKKVNYSTKLNDETLRLFQDFKLSAVVFILLINVKIPTIVGILTFMSMLNSVHC